MGSTVLPTKDSDRISWSINFESEFPALSATLGFINSEQITLLQDSAEMRYVILNAQSGAAFSKSCTAFKNDMLGGVGENQQTPVVPAFTATSPPPQNVNAGIIDRLSKAMNRAKLSSGYTATIGETLRIATVQTDSAISPDAKPTAKSTSMTGSIVRLDWIKSKYDGIFIDSQRNDETDWKRLDFDMRSPYEDIRPPLAANKPEERRYRMRYFMDNQAIGVWSDAITVITQP
jgi:hypothetical protein